MYESTLLLQLMDTVLNVFMTAHKKLLRGKSGLNS